MHPRQRKQNPFNPFSKLQIIRNDSNCSNVATIGFADKHEMERMADCELSLSELIHNFAISQCSPETLNSLNLSVEHRVDQYHPQQSSMRHRSDSESSFHSEHDSDNRSITELDDEPSHTQIDSMVNNMDDVMIERVVLYEPNHVDANENEYKEVYNHIPSVSQNDVFIRDCL